MPASMINAPTGGRPKVIGNSIATVAMVPMPGNTPTSVPTSAPIRQSRRLIGVNATPKPRARLEKSSAITPSRNQKTREQLQWQPQRVGKKQAAADGQADADNDGFLPPGFRCAERRDYEACKGRNHQTQRANGEREGKNRERDEQRPSPGVGRQMRTLGDHTDDHHREPQSKQQTGKHARSGSGAKRKATHALQVAGSPECEQRDGYQRYPPDEVLRPADPARHDGMARPMARRITHRHISRTRALCPFCLDRAAVQTILPTDFRQITPAKPKKPPASKSQSGLSRVAKARAAAVAVTNPATQVRSEVNARIRPLAPIRPIESGTSAA